MNKKVDWGHDYYTCIFTGFINTKQLEEALRDLHVHPEATSMKHVIIDFTEAYNTTLDTSKVALIAAQDLGYARSLEHNIKYAFISNTPKTITFLECYRDLVNPLSENLEVKIFPEFTHSLSWVQSDYVLSA